MTERGRRVVVSGRERLDLRDEADEDQPDDL